MLSWSYCLNTMMPFWVSAAMAGLWFEQAGAIHPVADQADMISQEVKYIWPVSTWAVPLASSDGKGLLEASLASNLAEIGERAFDKYVKEVLPVELKTDPKFAADFAASDASRMNLGFVRWQKRVYSELRKVPLIELSWDGSPIPHYKEVSYAWKEFYGSPDFKKLRHQIDRLSGLYLNNIGKDGERGRRRFRTFIWAEVYRNADSQRPHVHTGASTAGVFFSRYSSSKEGAQKFSFEDPRGINPPFGKTHNHQPKQGEVLLFPSWASHFITPHRSNSTNVYFNFVCWPPDGAPDLDWEDDATGDYVFRKQLNIKRPKARVEAPGTGKAERRAEL